MRIMTGKTGTPHVTSQQFRQLVEGTVGQGSYILTSGENLEPELSSNNLLKIRSGMMSHHGNLSVVDIGTYDEVTIQNGTQGMKRIDLVVNRYTKNEETGLEDNEWVVIMGTPVATDPVAPAYTEGNLQEGDLVDDCPVYEVHLDGINVTEVVKLLTVAPNISDLEEEVTELNGKIPITLTRLGDTPTGVSQECYYFPVFGIVLLRLGIPERVNTVYEAGTTYSLMNVPSGYRPSSPATALSCYVSGGSAPYAAVNSNGDIRLQPKVANIATGVTIQIAGFWFIN